MMPRKNADLLSDFRRVAEVHRVVRPILESALRGQVITPQFVEKWGAKTYLEFWQNSFGDKFFDMAMFVRLGSVAENAFREYFMRKVGCANRLALAADADGMDRGVFQRVLSPEGATLQRVYLNRLTVDLEAISSFKMVKEFFAHRHLYAHNSGLLNEKYVGDLKNLTGLDLGADASILDKGYPQVDVYYFEPLKRLNEFLDAVNETILGLP